MFSLKVNKIWTLFFLVKFFYLVIAIFIYSKFTQLGDTDRYLSGPTYGSLAWFYNSTHMMDFFAHSFSIVLGDFLANVPFLIISFYGVYYPVKRLKLSNKQLLFLLTLLSFPSYGVWTSIVSKESVSVFFLGIILGFFIDVVKRNSNKNYFVFFVAVYLCLIFKPQYMIGIVSMFCFYFFSRFVFLKGLGKLLLLSLFCFFSFLVLFIFKDTINDLSFIMPKHFTMSAGSTRINDIWVNDYDVFFNAPYGMFIAMWGPTIKEALAKPTHFLAFIESFFIFLFFSYFSLKMFLYSVAFRKINIFSFGVFFSLFFWVLFVHYPFGALNPGSAIRYRENFFSFIVILFCFLYNYALKGYLYSKYNSDVVHEKSFTHYNRA